MYLDVGLITSRMGDVSYQRSWRRKYENSFAMSRGSFLNLSITKPVTQENQMMIDILEACKKKDACVLGRKVVEGVAHGDVDLV